MGDIYKIIAHSDMINSRDIREKPSYFIVWNFKDAHPFGCYSNARNGVACESMRNLLRAVYVSGIASYWKRSLSPWRRTQVNQTQETCPGCLCMADARFV